LRCQRAESAEAFCRSLVRATPPSTPPSNNENLISTVEMRKSFFHEAGVRTAKHQQFHGLDAAPSVCTEQLLFHECKVCLCLKMPGKDAAAAGIQPAFVVLPIPLMTARRTARGNCLFTAPPDAYFPTENMLINTPCCGASFTARENASSSRTHSPSQTTRVTKMRKSLVFKLKF
jgi:hypothetical protein